MMKKTVLFLLFFISIPSFSQEDAWVYFTNKPNAQYFLDNPLQMLTSRALLRRSNQNIPLTLNDVPVHQPYIDQVDAIPGIVVMAKSKWLNCVHVRGALSDIQSLSSLSFVSSIYYANLSLNSRISTPVSESLFSKKLETEITYSYGNSANQIQMLNGHLLHQSDFVGTGKMIAVLDSGFLNANTILPLQNLYTNNLVLGGYNYVSGSADVYALDSHGTMVLSCMGGKVDGQLIGTAPNAQYYLFVTEDVVNENPVEESYWVEAAEEADRLGVDIITSSLGYFGYDNLNYSYSYSDMTGNKAFASKGANIAFSKGMIVVASAGNSGASTT
nr:S8 family serine peptidase [Flavobacterium sp.]